MVDSVSQEVWACWNLLNLQLGEKKKQKTNLDGSTKGSSGNTTSRNEVINHILYWANQYLKSASFLCNSKAEMLIS